MMGFAMWRVFWLMSKETENCTCCGNGRVPIWKWSGIRSEKRPCNSIIESTAVEAPLSETRNIKYGLIVKVHAVLKYSYPHIATIGIVLFYALWNLSLELDRLEIVAITRSSVSTIASIVLFNSLVVTVQPGAAHFWTSQQATTQSECHDNMCHCDTLQPHLRTRVGSARPVIFISAPPQPSNIHLY